MGMFWGSVKMREFCGYAFLKSKSTQAKNVQKVRQNRLLQLLVLSGLGDYFLNFEKNIWCFVRGLVEKDISVTGC